ncbi:hypothetical protein M0813_18723 [Anaeramoeba flamelloides]|uniref:D-isomer specific 2-hydroxyacid dehydrogenase NAD-binding domain-containing protein n=1 Tax=Anaeramoeba flamelloides TaxID=1746091 RepID=A0ABQ8YRL3_9EUKA|nr:hypothetical protein M0813_18723 [Anaeramoeba flamelloides]
MFNNFFSRSFSSSVSSLKPKIFVTRPLPSTVLLKLLPHFNLDIYKSKYPSETVLEARLTDCDGLMCFDGDRVPSSLISHPSFSNIKIIAQVGSVLRHLSVETATEYGIPVCVCPSPFTESTADLNLLLMLTVSRRIKESDQFLRDGKWEAWDPKLLIGGGLYGKTLGIIGGGSAGIAQAIAKRARAFDMQIIAQHFRESNNNTLERAPVSLETILKKSDFLTLAPPIRESDIIDGKFGYDHIELMKPSSYLISTISSSHLDLKSITKALKKKTIAGIGLAISQKDLHLISQVKDYNSLALMPPIDKFQILNETNTQAFMIAKTLIHFFDQTTNPPYIINPEVFR